MGRKLWELFITFFKIGAFTFGGGYAMIPLVQAEVVDKRGYITEKEFMNMIAIAEATPGVVAVNTATFVGYRIAGVPGGCIATLGVVLPSFVIISIIARVYVAFRQIVWIDWAFSGIRAGVMVLIVGAMVRMFKKSEKNIFIILLMIGALVAAVFTDINVVYIILAGAAAGMVRQLILCRKQAESCEDGTEATAEEAVNEHLS